MRVRSPRLVAALAAAGSLLGAASAGACIRVGVYQDRPEASLAALQKAVGPGVSVIST